MRYRPISSPIRQAIRSAIGRSLSGGPYAALDLNFAAMAASNMLDSRITFTRGSSGTRFNSSGALEVITSGNPRFTYDPVTHAALGLLIEEQRTNLLTYSEQFDNAAWAKSAVSVTANAGTAPDGNATADLISGDGTNSGHYVSYAAVFPSGAVHTFSVYAKAATAGYLHILVAGENPYAQVNLSTGAVVYSSSGTATNFSASTTQMPDGWWRVFVTAMQSSGTPRGIRVYPLAATSNTAAPSETTSSGIYIWGAQLEAGAFATSYIPTTSASVTRAADSATMTGTNFSSWFNATEGTFIADMNWSNFASVTPVMCDLSDATAQNQASLYLSGSAVVFVPKYAGINQAVLVPSGAQVATSTSRAGAAYKVDDFRAVSRGGAVSSDTLGTVPSGLTQIGIGRRGNSVSDLANAPISRLRYYNTALTNAQLQALTA